MQPHTDFPPLDGLDKLVHEERRLKAGELRCINDGKEKRAAMDKQLEAAGVDAVTVTIQMKDGPATYEVRRAVSQNGSRYASVTPIK